MGASGERVVVDAYVSDERGAPRPEGSHVTLVLGVAPGWPLGSPLHYVRNEKCRGNVWVDYDLTVTDRTSGRVFDTKAGRLSPLVDRFDLSGRFTHASGRSLSYASFTPRTGREKSPLLIWLHGGGEGGSDPSIPLLANRVTTYASDEIQGIFEGAYVLVPQCPGAWMHKAMSPRAWWTSRPARERAILAAGGGAIVAVLLFALAWLPMERTRTRLAAELPALRASLAEMRAQAEEVKALRALPAREPASATPLATLVSSGSLAQGLPGARLSVLGARRLQLAVDDASWTRLVEWIAATGAAHGLSVEEATVEALPATGRVRASLVLAAP